MHFCQFTFLKKGHPGKQPALVFMLLCSGDGSKRLITVLYLFWRRFIALISKQPSSLLHLLWLPGHRSGLGPSLKVRAAVTLEGAGNTVHCMKIEI